MFEVFNRTRDPTLYQIWSFAKALLDELFDDLTGDHG
jgi:hypothetical protein